MRNVLSLFNGISGCHLALDRAGIDCETVYYSEIDKFANKVTEHQYPQDVPLGDVTKWQDWDIDWSSIDLVTAGFPCQAWSVAGQQQGDKDPRGALFWTTLDIIKKVLAANPSAKFVMENVKMKKDFEQYITHHTTEALGYVEKTLINSALVSAQNRNRYYWTNFKIEQPKDKGLILKDILEDEVPENFKLSDEAIAYMNRLRNGKPRWEYHKNPIDGKAACLTANMFKGVPYGVLRVTGGAIRGIYNPDGTTSQRLELNGVEGTNALTTVQKDNLAVIHDVLCRKLTPLECERLQTIPDGFTDVLSNTQRYKALGNGWTIDVIAHILKQI